MCFLDSTDRISHIVKYEIAVEIDVAIIPYFGMNIKFKIIPKEAPIMTAIKIDFVFLTARLIEFKKPIKAPKITEINRNGTNFQASLNSAPKSRFVKGSENRISTEQPKSMLKL